MNKKLKRYLKKASFVKNVGESQMSAKKIKKARPKRHELRVTVRGMNYRLSPEQLSQLQEITDDDDVIPCTLELEPTNEVDPLAIKVIGLDPERKLFTGQHLGYVGRPSNAALSKVLKRGARITACLLDYVNSEEGEGELALEISLPKD